MGNILLLRSAGASPVFGYRHADGRGTTVPMHKGRDIAPSWLRQIARDIGLTVEKLLHKR